MAYSEKERVKIINDICLYIENGGTLRKGCEISPIDAHTFYIWIDADIKKSQQYTRATEIRADRIVDEILEISDSTGDDIILTEDGEEVTNHQVIQRDRLRVDSRKWLAGKMRPKKYGDSHQVKLTDGDGEKLKINAIFNIDLLDVPTDNSTQEDSET